MRLLRTQPNTVRIVLHDLPPKPSGRSDQGSLSTLAPRPPTDRISFYDLPGYRHPLADGRRPLVVRSATATLDARERSAPELGATANESTPHDAGEGFEAILAEVPTGAIARLPATQRMAKPAYNPDRLRDDVLPGFITDKEARTVYGVNIDSDDRIT